MNHNHKILFQKRLQLIQFLLAITSLFVPLFDNLEAKANPNLADELDLDPALIEKSPVLHCVWFYLALALPIFD